MKKLNQLIAVLAVPIMAAMLLMAATPTPTGFPVMVNSSGVVISPTNFWDNIPTSTVSNIVSGAFVMSSAGKGTNNNFRFTTNAMPFYHEFRMKDTNGPGLLSVNGSVSNWLFYADGSNLELFADTVDFQGNTFQMDGELDIFSFINFPAESTTLSSITGGGLAFADNSFIARIMRGAGSFNNITNSHLTSVIPFYDANHGEQSLTLATGLTLSGSTLSVDGIGSSTVVNNNFYSTNVITTNVYAQTINATTNNVTYLSVSGKAKVSYFEVTNQVAYIPHTWAGPTNSVDMTLTTGAAHYTYSTVTPIRITGIVKDSGYIESTIVAISNDASTNVTATFAAGFKFPETDTQNGTYTFTNGNYYEILLDYHNGVSNAIVRGWH